MRAGFALRTQGLRDAVSAAPRGAVVTAPLGCGTRTAERLSMNTQGVEFRRILVPTDFGEAASRATDVAQDLAKKYGATITLLHVYELPIYPYPEISVLPDVDFVTPIREAAQKELSKAFAAVQQSGCEARAQLACGVAWSEILWEAEQQSAELIVMGTHGRKGVMHAILGSVAEKIVRMANVPVLTVRGAVAKK